jgi:uncharacterized Zn-binding protein involved in type VI secretion
MANERITTKDGQYMLVSMAPDVCLTPVGNSVVPIPYAISHAMDQSAQCSENVFVNDEAVFLHGLSFVDKVKGDEAGSKGGVVTGVNGKVSHSLQKSETVFVNGHPIVRTGDRVHMNTKKP